MPLINCCRYIDQKIMPYADFLHSPTSFPITKKATKSYCGIFLSFIMIGILIGLSIREISTFNQYDTITYSQDFIKRREWKGKKITIGFNTSKEWDIKINFTLVDSKGENLNLTRCDKNLKEIENGTYHCLINYEIDVDYNSSHILKLSINLKDNYSNNEISENRIPFILAMREPKINHNSFENPLDISSDLSVERYICFFDIREITSFRRNLKYIKYDTKRVYFHKYNNNRLVGGVYLDDFEDSRKLRISDSEREVNKLVGTYRIMVSKKIYIYERQYKTLLDLLSNIGGYFGPLYAFFGIL